MPKQRKICEEVAAVFVQIPPALIEGIYTLAWPLSDAVCATVFKCQMNCCGEDDPPEQVHLSLASKDLSIMGVSWVSLNQPASVVEYGLSSTELNAKVDGTITTYKAASWVGNIHRAVMTKLEPGTKYYYRVGDGNLRWSKIFSFQTMVPDQEITYGIIGDMDFESNTTMANMITLVEDGTVNCILHPGDISYADGFEPHWDIFFRRIEPIAARVPYMVRAK